MPPAKPRKGSGDKQSHAVNLFEIRIEITFFDFLVVVRLHFVRRCMIDINRSGR